MHEQGPLLPALPCDRRDLRESVGRVARGDVGHWNAACAVVEIGCLVHVVVSAGLEGGDVGRYNHGRGEKVVSEHELHSHGELGVISTI